MAQNEALFLKKTSKVNLDSENAIQKKGKIVGFSDNCIWIGSSKFSLLLRKHSQLAVNMSESSLKISYLTKNIFF